MYLNEKEVLKNIEASNKNSFKVKALVYSNFRLLQKLIDLGHSWVRIAEGIQPCVDWDVKPDSIRAAFQSAVEYFSNPENQVIARRIHDAGMDVEPAQDVPADEISPNIPATEAVISPTIERGDVPTVSPVKPSAPNKAKLLESAHSVRAAVKQEAAVRIDEHDDVEASILQARRALKSSSDTAQTSSGATAGQGANASSSGTRPKISTSLM